MSNNVANNSSLLFIACVDLSDAFSGISRKVFAEYRVLNQEISSVLIAYHQNDIIVYRNNATKVYKNTGLHRRIMLFKIAKKYMNSGFEFAYVRRLPCNPFVIHLLSDMKKNGIKKIVWEIPTFPYDHEKYTEHFSVRNVMTKYTDKVFRRMLKKYVDRIVTFSSYKNIFGIETINTGNGIEVDTIRPRKILSNDNSINIIAVAVLCNWHGYDRLIQGIADYYKLGGTRQVTFHLVGDGNCLNQYKEQAQHLGVSEHIVFYGYRAKDEIDDIYDRCNLAVESLGWHRSKVEMGTSIKTREYLAKGLPIIASSPMDIFPEGWKYAYYAPIDDSPIQINEVIEFYDNIIREKPERQLAEEFRNICKRKCDMSVMMKPIVDYFMV